MSVVLAAIAVAAAAVALIVNVVLLDYGAQREDRIGRLNPNYALVRPASVPRPSPQRPPHELPDD